MRYWDMEYWDMEYWDMEYWDEPTWRHRQRRHRARVARWTDPHRRRRRHGERHPVLDFLFTYYSHPPGLLERWHPGPGFRPARVGDALPHRRPRHEQLPLRLGAAGTDAVVGTRSLRCAHHDAFRFSPPLPGHAMR